MREAHHLARTVRTLPHQRKEQSLSIYDDDSDCLHASSGATPEQCGCAKCRFEIENRRNGT